MACNPRKFLILILLLCAAPAAGASGTASRGYVDGTSFIDAIGDDAVVVEVTLHGAILRAVTRFDPDLHALIGGLESVHAVILDLTKGAPGDAGAGRVLDTTLAQRARERVSGTERRLLAGGWERLARIREGESDVRVLVLNDEKTIQGLAVMVVDLDDGQLIFANVSGVIDLAALEMLGETMDIPGLDRVPHSEDETGADKREGGPP